MLTEFARDHAFTIAWFGLMTMVWCGWGQEDPPRRRRWALGAGSVLGVAFAGVFGYGVFVRWHQGTALEGRYGWFGVVVLLEVLLAAVGCLVLSRKAESRWMAWWVALVVALHFMPLAFFFDDWSLLGLGTVQAVCLVAMVPKLRADAGAPTSRAVGPVMGASLLLFAAVSAVVFVSAYGRPW